MITPPGKEDDRWRRSSGADQDVSAEPRADPAESDRPPADPPALAIKHPAPPADQPAEYPTGVAGYPTGFDGYPGGPAGLPSGYQGWPTAVSDDPLVPFGVIDWLRRVFGVADGSFGPLVALSAVPAVLYLAFGLALNAAQPDQQRITEAVQGGANPFFYVLGYGVTPVLIGLFWLVFAVVGPFYQGAGFFLVVRAANRQPAALRDALRSAAPRVPALIGWSALALLMVGAPLLVVAVPAFQLGIPALLPLGVAVTSIPAIYLAGTLFSSLPGVVLVERAPVWRCFSLIRRRWWGTVVRYGIVAALFTAVVGLIIVTVGVAGGEFGLFDLAGGNGWISAVVGVIMVPLYYIPFLVLSVRMWVVTYAELRFWEYHAVTTPLLAAELNRSWRGPRTESPATDAPAYPPPDTPPPWQNPSTDTPPPWQNPSTDIPPWENRPTDRTPPRRPGKVTLGRRSVVALASVGALLVAALIGVTIHDATRPGATTGTPAAFRVTTIALPEEPRDMAITPDGRRAYVTSYGTATTDGNNVMVVDLAAGTMMTTIPVGPNPSTVAIAPDGRHAYVGVQGGGAGRTNSTVAVIDTASNVVTANVLVGLNPYDVAVSPDGQQVWVAINGSPSTPSTTVSAIDTATNTVRATVAVGFAPGGITISPDGRRAYVTNSGSQAAPGSTVAVIDTETDLVRATVPVGQVPMRVAVTPDGTAAYVTDVGTQALPGTTISVIDTADGTLSSTIPVGLGPYDLAPSPDGRRFYVTEPGTNSNPGASIAVIDTEARALVAVVPVGSMPIGLAVSPDGRRIYTANASSSSLSVIDTG